MFNNLLDNLSKWQNDRPDDILQDIQGLDIPGSFLNCMVQYNSYLLENQIKNILKTLIFIKVNIDCDELSVIRKNQVKHAISWCSKYGINLNYKSKYINSRFTL